MTGNGWREARERAGKTLRALAQEVGISPPFLSDVEHGRRRFSMETEAKVRAALGLGPRPAEVAPRCVVCEGPLTIDRWHQYDPSTGPPIYGPGSRGQYVEWESIRCPRCGIRYAHVPRPSPAPKEPSRG